jgi:hypothetical protein
MSVQHEALAALIGRALADFEVEQIDGHLSDPLGRRDDLIAALLSIARIKYVTTRKVAINVVGAYPGGPLEADALLGKLEAYADAARPLSRLVGRAMTALSAEPGLDLGDPSTHVMLDALVRSGVIEQHEAGQLMSIARMHDALSTQQVSDALNKAGD